MSLSRRDLLLILLLFIATRILLTVVGVVAVTRLPSTQGEEFTHLLDGGPALDMWYRWDAGFYATIATEGYDWQNERRPSDDMVFFPLYPAAIRAFMAVSGCGFSPYLSTCATVGGLLVSNLALFAGAVLLFDLAARYAGRPAAWRALGLLLLSPGAVYLSGVYTEGLFFLLCLLAFWLLDRDRFLLAVAVACLACLTRSVGVALIPPLLYHAWRSSSSAQAQASSLPLLRFLLALVPGLFFAGYILFAGSTAGDPLAYFSAYNTTWGRATGSPIDAFTVYFSGEQVSWFGWELSWIDLGATLAYLALAVVVLRRRLDWGLFALGALLVPVATGTLLSMPRFGTVIFPFYIVIGAWAGRRWQQAIVYGLAAGLMVFVTLRFVTWRWIA